MRIVVANNSKRALGFVALAVCLSLLPDRVEAQSDDGAMFFSAGLSSHLPSSDYVKHGFGADVTMGGVVGRHVFGLDFDVEAMGRCQKDIYTHKGDIYAGERISAIGINAFYGRQARRFGVVGLTPYLGLGARSYYGGVRDEKYIDDEDDDFAVYKTGVSFGVGLMADIPLFRSSDALVGHALCIKPYFSITEYGRQLNAVPAFNLTVQWRFEFDF